MDTCTPRHTTIAPVLTKGPAATQPRGRAAGGAAGVLQLQRTAGNRSVLAMLGAQRFVQRDEQESTEQGSEETLQPDEEKDLLDASGITLQRAYNARRQLAPLSFLGKPWVKRKSGNIANVRLYHEHIFLEDGGDDTSAQPHDWTNVGHMGSQGLGRDLPNNGYSKVKTGLSDRNVRAAVAQVAAGGTTQPGKYNLLTNNCQDFAQAVVKKAEAMPKD